MRYMNLKKSILVIATLVFVQLAFGQKNFQPGYIVTLEGDTVKGQIDYRNWAKTPEKVKFQNQAGGEAVTYRPDNIQSFSVEGEYYVSATVKTEVSSTKINNLDTHAELIFEAGTVFLQAIIIGEKSLYQYKDKVGRENFYIFQDGEFTLLEYKKYLKRKEGKALIREVKRYSGQLMIYLSDCSDIVSIMSRVEYRTPSLKKLFGKYYDCIEGKPDFEQVLEKVSLNFGIMAGSTISTLKVDVERRPSYSDADYTASFNPTGGVMLEIYMPKMLRRWSLNNEVLCTFYDIQGHYDDYLEENEVGIFDTHFRYSYVRINTLVRYARPVKSAHFYLNAGVTNGFIITGSNRFYQLREVGGKDLIGEGLAIPWPRNYEQGYIVGIGGVYKKFFLDIRMEKANGISQIVQVGTYITRYFMMLGYRF